MEWILYSNIGGLYLSWKDSGSNPFEKTQVYLSHTHTLIYTYTYIHTHTRRHIDFEAFIFFNPILSCRHLRYVLCFCCI